MIEEQRKMDEERQKLKKEQEKRVKEEQRKILGKNNSRPKLSFSLNPLSWVVVISKIDAHFLTNEVHHYTLASYLLYRYSLRDIFISLDSMCTSNFLFFKGEK